MLGATIAILPDHVIDQIAAGEVIERPSSVVKELVDNALDADARTITVEVEQGGRTLIRVIDDGFGMTPAQMTLAMQRHATSKIRHVDDLATLITKGFRGEALPTIASVSRFSLTSRSSAELAGTRLRVGAGATFSLDDVAAPVGTRIEVVDLFYNVPARLKFLKSQATEAAHISDTVTHAAMAHPHVHFRLRHDGRMALDIPPAQSVAHRIVGLSTPRIASQLHVVEGRHDGIMITALLAPPELAQTTARGVQLFVDRRPVRDRGLLHAITMSYGELIPRGRYPVASLLLEPMPGTVDYNVHPQKSEVRFSDPTTVQAAVRHVLRSAIAKSPWDHHGRAHSNSPMIATVATLPPVAPSAASLLAQRFASQIASGNSAARAVRAADNTPYYRTTDRTGAGQSEWQFESSLQPTRTAQSWSQQHEQDVATLKATKHGLAAERSHSLSSDPSTFGAVFFASLRYLGQLDLTYLVCECEGELVLLDQHACHERIAYARLKERTQTTTVSMQRMLLPTTVEVSAAHVKLAAESSALLEQVGFDVEVFGATSIAIKAVPSGLRQVDPQTVLLTLLDEWSDKGAARAIENRLEHALATIACHSVVRAGDRLMSTEVEALLNQLDSVDFRSYQPHGRPALLRISIDELARRFGRT
jgi:DNA mismatch repair protein MutL